MECVTVRNGKRKKNNVLVVLAPRGSKSFMSFYPTEEGAVQMTI